MRKGFCFEALQSHFLNLWKGINFEKTSVRLQGIFSLTTPKE